LLFVVCNFLDILHLRYFEKSQQFFNLLSGNDDDVDVGRGRGSDSVNCQLT